MNSFIETVSAIHIEYVLRGFGGLLFLLGALIMVWNIYQTIRGRTRQEEPYGMPAAVPAE